jgi:CcmD family protein
MDKLIKRTGFVVACCLVNLAAMAQGNSSAGADTTDFMRSNGKIYVVITVAAIIISGLFLYLLSLERKIKKLERE